MAHVLINHNLRGQAWTPPAQVYIALFSYPEVADLTASVFTNELSAGAYSRKEVLLGPASSRITTNTSNVSFDIATEDWPDVTHFGIVDASSSGNMLLWGELPFPVDIIAGQVFNFPVSNIGVEIE